jgi:hypothetical protein
MKLDKIPKYKLNKMSDKQLHKELVRAMIFAFKAKSYVNLIEHIYFDIKREELGIK